MRFCTGARQFSEGANGARQHQWRQLHGTLALWFPTCLGDNRTDADPDVAAQRIRLLETQKKRLKKDLQDAVG